MRNFYKEILSTLIEYNLDPTKVVFLDDEELMTFSDKEEFIDFCKKKYDFEYDDSFGRVYITNFKIIIDDHTWLERESYDGEEGFVLKAHPLNSKYKNMAYESHFG